MAERLFEQRIVLAHGQLTEERATVWCAGLLTLGAVGREPIKLHLGIPDGEPGAALTMLDTLDSRSRSRSTCWRPARRSRTGSSSPWGELVVN